MRKLRIEDVGSEAVEIEDGLDADEPLFAHVGKLLEDGGRITVRSLASLYPTGDEDIQDREWNELRLSDPG